MKHKLLNIFTTSLFLAMSLSLQAQHNWDLVTIPTERFDQYGVDSTIEQIINDSSIGVISCYYACYHGTTVFRSDAGEGLVVYGVAYSVFPMALTGYEYLNTIDTSTVNWEEFLCMYKHIGDSMLLVAKAPYNQFAEPTYVWPPMKNRHGFLLLPQYIDATDSTKIRTPLFERYFDTAKFVTDSFYVGTTGHCNMMENYDCMPYGLRLYSAFLYTPLMEYSYSRMVIPADIIDNITWQYENVPMGVPMTYPILTPDPNRSTPTPVDTVLSYFDTTAIDTTIIDTTGQGIDTTGVDTTGAAIYSPQLLERYTQLIPSVVEAGGTATVLSSFHLQAVELYDAAGRLVQSRPARGTAAAVDCTALPRGSYLVRLVTTAGTTTKKLTVR